MFILYIKSTSGLLNLKGFRRDIVFDDVSKSKRESFHEFEKKSFQR